MCMFRYTVHIRNDVWLSFCSLMCAWRDIPFGRNRKGRKVQKSTDQTLYLYQIPNSGWKYLLAVSLSFSGGWWVGVVSQSECACCATSQTVLSETIIGMNNLTQPSNPNTTMETCSSTAQAKSVYVWVRVPDSVSLSTSVYLWLSLSLFLSFSLSLSLSLSVSLSRYMCV